MQQLQSRASPDTVLVATSTRDLVRGFFDYREVGRLTLEGLAESAPVWQVVGLSAAESRFACVDLPTEDFSGADVEADVVECLARPIAVADGIDSAEQPGALLHRLEHEPAGHRLHGGDCAADSG